MSDYCEECKVHFGDPDYHGVGPGVEAWNKHLDHLFPVSRLGHRRTKENHQVEYGAKTATGVTAVVPQSEIQSWLDHAASAAAELHSTVEQLGAGLETVLREVDPEPNAARRSTETASTEVSRRLCDVVERVELATQKIRDIHSRLAL